MRRILLAAILMLIAAPAMARMYQWVDPDTQTPQLSGTPPTWYRSAEKGPRVFVIENGKVIDDTKVTVSESDRLLLRENALVQAERDRDNAKSKLMEAERMKAAMGVDEEAETEEPIPEDTAAAPVEEPPPPTDAAQSGPTPEEMKALIDQWEQMRTQGAKQVVGDAPAEIPTTKY